MTTDNRNSFNAQIDAKTRLSFLKKIKNSVTPPSPLPPHGPCKAWTNHDHEFILMPAIGLLVLNSKIAYSTTKFCLGKFSVCGNKWMVNGSPPPPPPPQFPSGRQGFEHDCSQRNDSTDSRLWILWRKTNILENNFATVWMVLNCKTVCSSIQQNAPFR